MKDTLYNENACSDMKNALDNFKKCINITSSKTSKQCKDNFAHTFARYKQPKKNYTQTQKKWLSDNRYPKLAKRVQ